MFVTYETSRETHSSDQLHAAKAGSDDTEGSANVLSPFSTANVCRKKRKRLRMNGVMMRKMTFLGFLNVISKFLKVSNNTCGKKPRILTV